MTDNIVKLYSDWFLGAIQGNKKVKEQNPDEGKTENNAIRSAEKPKEGKEKKSRDKTSKDKTSAPSSKNKGNVYMILKKRRSEKCESNAH